VRNKIVKKVLIIGAVSLLSIGVIYAYFMTGDLAENIFGIGKVEHAIEEPSYDPEHPPVHPGEEVVKDPQIRNVGDSTEYLFAEVSVPYKNVLLYDENGHKTGPEWTELFSYEATGEGWTLMERIVDQANEQVIYRYAYTESDGVTMKPVSPREKTSKIFESVTAAKFVESDELTWDNPYEVSIKSFGVQKDSLGSNAATDYTSVWQITGNQAPVSQERSEDAGFYVDVLNYTKGATTNLDANKLQKGTVGFTVDSDSACMVAILENNAGAYTLTRLACTTTDDVHSYSMDVQKDTVIVIAQKGDADLDGDVDADDATAISQYSSGVSNTSTDGIVGFNAADVNIDGAVNATDANYITRFVDGSYEFVW